MSAIIHKFNSSARKNADQHSLFIKQIVSCLNTELSELIGRLFDGADDILFQLAENAESNEDQNQYFDTMRMLRAERATVAQLFASNLKTYLKPVNQTQAETHKPEDDELSLVDQDEMEEMVAISAMHSKAMSLYGEAVNHLEARIEFLSLKSPSFFAKDALAPKNICESFKNALTDIELSTNNKLILYKLFDQEVILHLQPLYTKINQLFIDQGILPQIKLNNSAQKKPVYNKPLDTSAAVSAAETDVLYTENAVFNPQQIDAHDSAQKTTAENSNSQQNGIMQQEVHRLVNQFIQGELTASGPGIPASFTTANNNYKTASTPYYDRRDVMLALSNLQHNVAQSSAPAAQVNAKQIKNSLLADMGSRSGGAVTRQVSQVDEKTIDFIEMLFDAIVEDISISEPVKNLLLRLQIPLIKVAMIDSDFFVNADHPCKATLNLLAHLGRGISSRDDELFIALEHAVENLLNEFDSDISSFSDAVNHLEKILHSELKQAAEQEKQTQKTVLQLHAREMVLAELQFLAAHKILLKPVQKLILKHWSTLMFHRYIKFGKNSDEWKDASGMARQLINLLQPIESSQAYFTLTAEKDDLLETMHQLLLQTRQNPTEIETEINNLYQVFEDMLANSTFNPLALNKEETYFTSVNSTDDIDSAAATLDLMPEPVIDFNEQLANDPLLEQAVIAREKVAELPQSVRPGVWFEVYNGDENAVRRAKLSVIIMEEAKLVFVDRVGIKVMEKDAAEFTEELVLEKSKPIADHSAFDHALGLVINSLSRSH